MILNWSHADQLAALAEGWDIWECSGSSHGPFQLQAVQFPDDFDDLGYDVCKFVDEEGNCDDTAAWQHVWDKASAGSMLHMKAIGFLLGENPPEYHRIREHCTGVST